MKVGSTFGKGFLKNNMFFLFSLLTLLGLASCQLSMNPRSSTPGREIDQNPTFTLVSPDPQIPTSAVTNSPTFTISDEEKAKGLNESVSKPIVCEAPSLWGITPGKTSFADVKNYLMLYGLEPFVTNFEGKVDISTSYHLENGLSVNASMPIKDDVVEQIELRITANSPQEGRWEGWGVYSPRALIQLYGEPSNVEFSASYGPDGHHDLFLSLYFIRTDLIVEYYIRDFKDLEINNVHLCPMLLKYDGIDVWLARKPFYSSRGGNPLQDVSSLSISEFSKRMLDDPKNACFEVDGRAVLQ